MNAALLIAVVFLAGIVAGTYGHIIATERRPRRRRPGPPPPSGHILKSTPQPADKPAVTDVAAALRNLGAAPAAALTVARAVVARHPAASFQDHFRVAVRDLQSTASPEKGRRYAA